jgi:hypothetical protein
MYKVEMCFGIKSLRSWVNIVNNNGYEIISMTQNNECYTIIYR